MSMSSNQVKQQMAIRHHLFYLCLLAGNGKYAKIGMSGDARSLLVTNKEIRYELYHISTSRFINGILGKGNRKELLLCVVGEIKVLKRIPEQIAQLQLFY
jgi:hypothetical protein